MTLLLEMRLENLVIEKNPAPLMRLPERTALDCVEKWGRGWASLLHPCCALSPSYLLNLRSGLGFQGSLFKVMGRAGVKAQIPHLPTQLLWHMLLIDNSAHPYLDRAPGVFLMCSAPNS